MKTYLANGCWRGQVSRAGLLLGRRPVPSRIMDYEVVVGSHFSCGSFRVTRQMATSSVMSEVLKSH